MPVRRGRVLAVHKARSQLRDVAAELAARGHLNARGQSFSAAIGSPLLRARPVSTVTQGCSACHETRDRHTVQRRGCMQRRSLRNFERGSARRDSISAPLSPDTPHRSSPTVCLGASPCGSTHAPKVGLKIRKVQAFSECGHRGLAALGMAVCRHPILVVAEG